MRVGQQVVGDGEDGVAGRDQGAARPYILAGLARGPMRGAFWQQHPFRDQALVLECGTSAALRELADRILTPIEKKDRQRRTGLCETLRVWLALAEHKGPFNELARR